uniref:Uncharacterized protein n=1 Tax=Neospora caninum (strain Liverpool) TaxID=572307 RepID=F0JB85_NEOCL|nr:hypothetical protein, conserved [Neospora caninum Liverpool]CEL71352.1 TPA: hypothetical protein, conserved [Neospora caninum Liverpool]
MLRKLQPCLPMYRDVLAAMEQTDFKPAGLVVNSEAQAKLGEFFLCCACALRPKEIDSAGTDNNALLRIAQQTAEEDFEPWLQEVRSFVADFDANLADRLETAAVLRARDEGLFWEASFEAAAPNLFDALVAAAEKVGGARQKECEENTSLSSSAASSPSSSAVSSSPSSSAVSSSPSSSAVSSSSSSRGEDAERSGEPTELEKAVVSENEDLVMEMYKRWLVAVSQPIKREMRDALSHFGLLVVKEELEEAARSRQD